MCRFPVALEFIRRTSHSVDDLQPQKVNVNIGKIGLVESLDHDFFLRACDRVRVLQRRSDVRSRIIEGHRDHDVLRLSVLHRSYPEFYGSVGELSGVIGVEGRGSVEGVSRERFEGQVRVVARGDEEVAEVIDKNSSDEGTIGDEGISSETS